MKEVYNNPMNYIYHLFASCIYFLVNAVLRALHLILFRWRIPQEPKTLLVFRTGYLGDTLCAVPAMQALEKRFPKARRILMTNASEANRPCPLDVLDRLVAFDCVIPYHPHRISDYPYMKMLLSRLRNEKIDLLVYLSQPASTPFRLIRDMFFLKGAGCKSACGFRLEMHRFFPLSQRKHRKFDHEASRLMKTLAPLGIAPQVAWSIPRVPGSFEAFEEERPIIAVHPSAKFLVKKWPLERFIEVARHLCLDYNAKIVVIGGADTKPEAEVFLKALKGNVLDLTGRAGFLETAEVLRKSRFLLSNDSGPIHIAAAVNTPVVALFSARDFPNAWYPWGENHEVLRKDVDCQICFLETCPVMTCIKQITVEEVIAACKRILEKNLPGKSKIRT